MFDSSHVYRIIESIAETSSKNDKLAILKKHAGNELLAKVLKLAYDPLITYGIIPQQPDNNYLVGEQFDNRTFKLLDDLASRVLTGHAARDAVGAEFNRLNRLSAELLWRVIRKDLRAGFSESTINKAIPKLIPTFPYMRCSLLKGAKIARFNWSLGVISQEKADGMFVNIDHVNPDEVNIRSRQGTAFPTAPFAELIAEVTSRLDQGTQSHGELLVTKGGVILPREIGNGILNSVIKGGEFGEGERPIFKIWDQIPLSEVIANGRYYVSYRVRLASIIRQLKGSGSKTPAIELIETRICHSVADTKQHFREMLAAGKEGTVFKDSEAIWGDYTSTQQIKLKLAVQVDMQVVAIVPGRAGTKNEGRAGSITVRSLCGDAITDVAVKNEAMRDAIDAYPEDWIDRIIVVCFNAIMPPTDADSNVHSLFLPRMAELSYRIDKTIPDTLQQIRDQYEAAIQAA